MKRNKLVTNRNYQNLLKELKSIIDNGQYHAYKSVDNIKVQTYWQIGERIVREELKYKVSFWEGDFPRLQAITSV